MSSEALDKTVITDNWQIFSKIFFQHFIHHKNILKITKLDKHKSSHQNKSFYQNKI